MKQKFSGAMLFIILLLCLGLSFSFASDWIIQSKSGKLPAKLKDIVADSGGKLKKFWDGVGIAIADFQTREDAEAIEAHGVYVMPDVKSNFLPGIKVQKAESIGTDETYYGYQWHLPVIEADKAWDKGVTGFGARVAVLDTGIWYLHPDLFYNIDFAASASFVPGTTDFMDGHGHGTHVSGIIAAADNDWGSIGVAPDATLIGVKVLDDGGSGYQSWIVSGIIHAVQADADIINMSLGSFLKKSGYLPYYSASDAAKIKNLYTHVINWAISEGTLVVCAAGNDGYNLDHLWEYIHIPSEAGNGITVSATGPSGFENFDNFASYSNYGNSSIWLAAPGGDFTLYPSPGWHYDMVFSTTVGGWSWMAGTSMAATVVSGVAALVISTYGKMKPNVLKNHLGKTADDLGKPGKDPYYGKGRVNAFKAVKN